MVLLRDATFTNIQKSLERALGDEAKAELYEAGISAGKGSAAALLGKWKERGQEFIDRWSEFYGSDGVGWFKVNDIRMNENAKVDYLQIDQSFIAESYGDSDRPVCDFLCGFFVGTLEEVFGEAYSCEEVECLVKGHAHCVFRFELVSD